MKLHDMHIHMDSSGITSEEFVKRLDKGGVDKAVLLSHRPASFTPSMDPSELSASKRLAIVMDWAEYSDRIIPFFWIDPLEEDAVEQVDKAVEAGIAGFKVICNRHFPCDDKPMKVWEHIATKDKPILFHSGILYSRSPSSNYNRPANFEALIFVPNLRFAMAHVSWPWHDECLAVYGHWQSVKRSGQTAAEMFIDTTPGSPKIYRKEIFAKIYGIGYDVENNIIFGTDCSSDYDVDYLKYIVDMDEEAFDAAGVSKEAREKYYSGNLSRFLLGDK